MKKAIKILGFNLVLLIILLGILEVWARIDYKKRFPGIKRPIQVIYPPNPINGFQDPAFKREKPPDEFRILCLGASTSKWANYPKFIAWAFQGQPWIQSKGLQVKAYSTGFEAHTSLDSYYKYKYLYDGYDFDLVVIYHGINELRANCCPSEMYKEDYSHFGYYAVLNPMMKLMDIPLINRSFLALKIVSTLGETVRKRKLKNNPHAFLSEHEPFSEWLEYGEEIRSAESFKGNLQAIICLAKKRKQPALLMTFAHVIPADYSQKAFAAGKLGYACGEDIGLPMEIYGKPEHVAQGIAVHNEVITDIAGEQDCHFIDQDSLLGGDMVCFIDVCHFSPEGITRFAMNIAFYFLEHPLR